MKKSTKRDLGIFLGIVALVTVVFFGNSQLQRGDLAKRYEKLRTGLEQTRIEEGLNLLKWNLVRKTKGSLRKGGKFPVELMEYDNTPVHMIGFMVPDEQFRDVTEFLMLPIPIECYFCAMPPTRDVLLVQMREGETTSIYEEPVLILGNFSVHKGPDQKFFYSLNDATIDAAEDSGELNRRRIELQHMLPDHEPDPGMLLEPYVEDETTD